MNNNSISRKTKLSVVIPVYRCDECLQELYDRLTQTLTGLELQYEIIFVDDRSPDNAWITIVRLAREDKNVMGIRLSKNFGQHRAITAGLEASSGDWIVVMDGDLQDRPEGIEKMYYKVNEGFDIVFGKRIKRTDGIIRKIGSRIYVRLLSFFTGEEVDTTITHFSIVSRKVIESMKLMKEQHRSYTFFLKLLGFNVGYVEIEHSQRYEGKSSYSLTKLLNLLVNTVFSYSNKPLKVAIVFGFLLSIFSMGYLFFILTRYLIFGIRVLGWTSLIVSMYFLFGVLFSYLGLLGIYVGKIFDETKARPLYIISESINYNKD